MPNRCIYINLATAIGLIGSAASAWAGEPSEKGHQTEWFLVPSGPHVVLATRTPPIIAPEDAEKAIELHSMLNRSLGEHLRKNSDQAATRFAKSRESRLVWRELQAVLIGIYRKSGVNPSEYSLNLSSRTFVRWTSQDAR